ncbi:hypothetical protein FHS72_001778 [Loktanella ponticola]|uniref:Uncharacterized protein n=1 Tax=Yoonia ponticola TaxID=1524255 RepID=A0A7W9EXZ5_9RHOB|nr:hypothetical protein [Yoonia ponticola]MBB5722154.1 hypothetical protein [Yoonia ponticola]
MKKVLIAATFAVCASVASAQSESELDNAAVETSEQSVSYTVVSEGSMPNGTHAITVRSNDVGENTYTKFSVSCDPYLIGVVATADSMDELSDNPNNDPIMEEIVRGSGENQIADEACGI